MSNTADELWAETFKAAQVQDHHMITGAILVLRSTNMETGKMTVHIGSTEETDYIVQLGLLTAAMEIVTNDSDD